jgi:hypothetical protein
MTIVASLSLIIEQLLVHGLLNLFFADHVANVSLEKTHRLTLSDTGR